MPAHVDLPGLDGGALEVVRSQLAVDCLGYTATPLRQWLMGHEFAGAASRQISTSNDERRQAGAGTVSGATSGGECQAWVLPGVAARAFSLKP